MEIETRPSPEPSASWLRSRTGIAFLVFLAVALYSEHRAHVIQALPWLLVLLCPLMHLFLRGHGSHGHGGGSSTTPPRGGGS